MKSGIVSYGAYVPKFRILPKEIGRVWGQDGEAMGKESGQHIVDPVLSRTFFDNLIWREDKRKSVRIGRGRAAVTGYETPEPLPLHKDERPTTLEKYDIKKISGKLIKNKVFAQTQA